MATGRKLEVISKDECVFGEEGGKKGSCLRKNLRMGDYNHPGSSPRDAKVQIPWNSKCFFGKNSLA